MWAELEANYLTKSGALHFLWFTSQMLWTKDLMMNTVHVQDVCRALWHLREAGSSGEVFNLADKGATSEGTLVSIH